MDIRSTLAALRQLAAEIPHDEECVLEDMLTAEHLLATCEPALAPAAFQAAMQMYLRLRDRALEAA